MICLFFSLYWRSRTHMIGSKLIGYDFDDDDLGQDHLKASWMK